VPRPTINVDVPNVYGSREEAHTTASRIADVVGDQEETWAISVSEAKHESGWLVEVVSPRQKWALVFDGLDQTAEVIVKQFKLDLAIRT
jgi:hypothetical protein